MKQPTVHPDAWVAPGAVVVGDVTLGAQASVWYTAVLRGDGDAISVGERSNVQDGCVLHTDPGFPVRMGSGVSVGHRAVLHGCTIEDDVLVGMGAIVMNGAVIGAGSMVGAGAVVSQGMVVPPRSMVLGLPAKVRRELTDDEVAGVRHNAEQYVALVAQHRG
ncbi:MAG: gamma carbonic anhydrase family protein [Nocardioides sp.]|nr:gamma carbonic anhydrase family protein [Nocardioides sp.]